MKRRPATQVFALSAPERVLLLSLAREAICSGLDGSPLPDAADSPERLCRACGAFVTLTSGGLLRGCIGRVRPSGPLHSTVQEMARAAAFSDPRFPPVERSELDGLSVEISVLSPFETIPPSDVSRIQVGIHGLYLTRGSKSGLLLPQVAMEHGWSAEEFLEQTARKAGMAPRAWREAQIELFSAEVFGDQDF
jgi:AmmeMemoRadiSam system protein A